MEEARTTYFQNCLDRFRAGERGAVEDLLNAAMRRLERLTRKMLAGYPDLRRWEQTDDVLQNALLRLHHALESVRPESLQHFFRLAALQIRRELIDLARHYFGRQG